jgi:DUF1009 family protein
MQAQSNTVHKIGIIAGHGYVLKDAIDACKHKGFDFFVMALYDQTDPDMVKDTDHEWCYIGQIGKILGFLRSRGVTHLLMAGRFHRPNWKSMKMDSTGLMWAASIGLKSVGDDTLLRAVTSKLEAEGFALMGLESIVEGNLLNTPGLLSAHEMEERYIESAKMGIALLNDISMYDIGQSVVIQGKRVLGIEGPEGTNELIKRCAAFIDHDLSNGAILVKDLKLTQDSRVDRPVIGPRTLEVLHQNGFAGLVVKNLLKSLPIFVFSME